MIGQRTLIIIISSIIIIVIIVIVLDLWAAEMGASKGHKDNRANEDDLVFMYIELPTYLPTLNRDKTAHKQTRITCMYTRQINTTIRRPPSPSLALLVALNKSTC